MKYLEELDGKVHHSILTAFRDLHARVEKLEAAAAKDGKKAGAKVKGAAKDVAEAAATVATSELGALQDE